MSLSGGDQNYFSDQEIDSMCIDDAKIAIVILKDELVSKKVTINIFWTYLISLIQNAFDEGYAKALADMGGQV